MVKVGDLKITHVIMVAIMAFVLYSLMSSCSSDGFSVGGQSEKECEGNLKDLQTACCQDNDNCPSDYPLICDKDCEAHLNKILTNCSKVSTIEQIKKDVCLSCGTPPDNCDTPPQDKCEDKPPILCGLSGGECIFNNGKCKSVCGYEYNRYSARMDPKICHNGGLCKEGPVVGTKSCECTSDWTGPTCEIEVPVCFDGEMCHNGGSCHEKIYPDGKKSGKHECRCLDTWTGPHCKIKTPPGANPHHPAPQCPLALPNVYITPWNKKENACECPEGMKKEHRLADLDAGHDEKLWRCRSNEQCPLISDHPDSTPWTSSWPVLIDNFEKIDRDIPPGRCSCPEGMDKEKDGEKDLWRCRKK